MPDYGNMSRREGGKRRRLAHADEYRAYREKYYAENRDSIIAKEMEYQKERQEVVKHIRWDDDTEAMASILGIPVKKKKVP